MFKIGDKVTRTIPGPNDTFGKMGKIYTVKEVQPLRLLEIPYNTVTASNFKLVSESNELEELVKKANEGYEASHKIWNKYLNEVEIRTSDEDSYKNRNVKSKKPHHIKIKSKTRKFKVAQWDAEIDEKMIKIGCKIFYKENLMVGLKNLIKNNFHFDNELYATKNGIKYNDNEITWQQAEELLKELEK